MEIYFNKETKGWLLRHKDNTLKLSAEEFENIRGGVLPFFLAKMKKETELEKKKVAE